MSANIDALIRRMVIILFALFAPISAANFRMLVVYTPRTDSALTPSLRNTIKQNVIYAINNSFIASTPTSRTLPRVQLAGIRKLDYTETPSSQNDFDMGVMQLDLNRLRISNDGYMDEIHNYRAIYAADVVMIITNKFGHTGSVVCKDWPTFPKCSGPTNGIGANADYAFMLVSVNGIGWGTPSHEIGHMFGCRHDNDTTQLPYNYARGWWRAGSPGHSAVHEIMSIGHPPEAAKRYWFSSHEIPGRGSETQDCTQLLQNRMSEVSGFVDSMPYTSFQNDTIMDQEYIDVIGGEIEVSDVTFESGSESILRAENTVTIGAGTTVKPGANIIIRVGQNSTPLPKSTSQNGTKYETTQPKDYEAQQSFKLIKSTQGYFLSFNLPQESDVSSSLYDLKGNVYVKNPKQKKRPGTYREVLRFEKPTKGVYFLEIIIDGTRTIKKLVIK